VLSIKEAVELLLASGLKTDSSQSLAKTKPFGYRKNVNSLAAILLNELTKQTAVQFLK